MSEVHWIPIEDGMHWDAAHVVFVMVKGDWLRTGSDYDSGVDVKLNSNRRLCRLVEAQPDAAPLTPAVAAILSEWRDEYEMRANSWLAVNPDSKEGLRYKAQVEAIDAWLAQIEEGDTDATE